MIPIYQKVDWEEYKKYFNKHFQIYLEHCYKICQSNNYIIKNYKNFIKKNLFIYLSEYIFCEYCIEKKIFWPEYNQKDLRKRNLGFIPRIKISSNLFKFKNIQFGYYHRFPELKKFLKTDHEINQLDFRNILNTNKFFINLMFELSDLNYFEKKIKKILYFLNINFKKYLDKDSSIEKIYTSAHKLLNPINLFFITFFQEVKKTKIIVNQIGLIQNCIKYSHLAELENLISDKYHSWGVSTNHFNYEIKGSHFYKRKVEKNNEYVEQIFLNDIPIKNYPTPISEFSSMTYQEAKLYFFENDLRTIKSLIKKCKNPKLRAKHVSYEIYRNLLKKENLDKYLIKSNADVESKCCKENYFLYFTTGIIELFNIKNVNLIPVFDEKSIYLNEKYWPSFLEILKESNLDKKEVLLRNYIKKFFKQREIY